MYPAFNAASEDLTLAASPSPPGAVEDGPRLPALDGLRGLAILLVVVWHYYACVPRPEWLTTIPALERLAGYGWTGVPLFFILSGFLIGRILIRNRGAAGYYRTFLVRRATRILPLYFAGLALFVVCRAAMPAASHTLTDGLFLAKGPLWAYGAFLQNISMAQGGGLGGSWLSVTWSLAVEEQFYLLLPVIVAVVRPTMLPRVLVGTVVFAVLFRWAVLQFQLAHPTAVIVLLPSRIDNLALGVVVGILFDRHLPARVTRWLALLGIGLCVYAIGWLGSGTAPWMATLYLLIALVFGLLVLHVTCSADGRVNRLIRLKPLRWCGGVSYFVYLFHQPVNHLMHGVLRGRVPDLADRRAVLVTFTSLAMVLGLGELSRRYFEGPLIRFGRRWHYGLTLGRVRDGEKAAA